MPVGTPLPLEVTADTAVAPELERAEELARTGKLEAAVAAYTALLGKASDNEEVHFNYAHLLARMGKTNEAVVEYETALKLLPTYAEAHNNLGNLLVKQKKFDEAQVRHR